MQRIDVVAIGSRRISYIPPQHGAWAFLALPYAIGLTIAPWTPALLLLGGAWLCAYPVTYFATAAVTYRGRRMRYARPATPWAIGFMACGLPLILVQPWLLIAAVGMTALASASAAFARHHEQRSLYNDGIVIAQCTALVPIMWAVGQGSPTFAAAPAIMWGETTLVAFALTSSTLHVRSFLRGRGDPRIARSAIAVPIIALVFILLTSVLTASWSFLLMAIPFTYFAIRAVSMQSSHPSKPMVIGLVDLGGFALMVVVAAVL